MTDQKMLVMPGRAWFASVVVGAALVCCSPDFDALSRGAGGATDGGAAGERSDAAGSSGAGSVGGASAGASGTSPSAGTAGSGAAAGSSTSGSGGGGGETPSGGASGQRDPGDAGAGGAIPCLFAPSSTVYTGFDDLSQMGFSNVSYDANTGTKLGATATGQVDPLPGVSCPGVYHLTANWQGYSVSPDRETANGNVHFAPADWTGAVALHTWLKVATDSTTNATFQHMSGVQVFVISGDYLYTSKYDGDRFRSGDWIEMVLPIPPSAWFEPKTVFRFGVQALLKAAPSAGVAPTGAPAVPPVTHVYLDDAWVEFQAPTP